MVRCLFLACAIASSVATATSVPELSPAEVAAKSDVVVEGREVARTSAWVGRRIFTFVTIDIDRTLKGALSEDEARTRRVVVAIPGGVVGALGQKVAGAPVIELGARYALCLSHANGPNGARGVVGYYRGLWRLDADAHKNAALERALGDAP